MQKGYFTSRSPIIDWINHLLKISMSKIEQLGSGNIYCQILDAAFPEKVPLRKVKWDAYLEIDFIHNFKILQICFDHLGIEKIIDIPKLVKAKYQDNLQFIQWMKASLENQIQPNYDPISRRKNVDIHLILSDKKKSINQNQNMVKSLINIAKIKSIPNIKNKNNIENYKSEFNISSQNNLQHNTNVFKKIRRTSVKIQACQNVKDQKCNEMTQSITMKRNASDFIRKSNKQPLKSIKNIIQEKYENTHSLIIESDQDQPQFF